MTTRIRIGNTESDVLHKLVISAALILGMSILRDDAKGEGMVDIVAGDGMNEIAGFGIRTSGNEVVGFGRIGRISIFSAVNGKEVEG